MSAPEKIANFVFPRVAMFPETKSRERLRAEGKQNPLFPKGADIKCFVISLKGVFEKTYTAKRL